MGNLERGVVELREMITRDQLERQALVVAANFFTLLAVSVGLIAAVIPARRAAQLDPATAIRGG